ncbi:MAG: NAD(P)/FAD-dependent oxidoreductase [Nitrospira sp.]
MAMSSASGRRAAAKARARATSAILSKSGIRSTEERPKTRSGFVEERKRSIPSRLAGDRGVRRNQPAAGEEPDQLMPFEYAKQEGRPSDKKVIIVGGGLAGLMAGWMLASQNFDVMLLEARATVGGRVQTKGAGSRLLEVGGELIGSIHKRWIKLANYFNLGLSPISTETMYGQQELQLPLRLDKRGRTYESPSNPNQWDTDQVYKSLSERANLVDPFQPWNCAKAHDWDNMSVHDWIEKLRREGKISQDTADLLDYELSTNQASSTREQSFLGLLAATSGGSYASLAVLTDEERKNDVDTTPVPYWGDECETFRCSSGNQQLAKELARECKDAGGRVRTLEAVRTIERTAGGWQVTTESFPRVRHGKGKRTKPQTSAKGRYSSYQADWIVLAIPPSVFEHVRFIPSELEKEMRPFARFQTGAAVKYFAPVNDRFWLSEQLAPAAQDVSFGIVWENTDSQNMEKSRPKSLTVFTGGHLAKSSHWKSDPDRYFQDKLGRIYNGFSEHVDKAGCDFAEWPKFYWTQCGYSCPGKGQVTTLSKAFTEPHGKLVFAGEHTSTAFFGFMEGALESGLRAARVICERSGLIRHEALPPEA